MSQHRRVRDNQQQKAETADEADDKPVAVGDHADVWLFGEAREEYEALLRRTDTNSRRSAKQLPRYFGRFANGHPLSEQMYKLLGRHKTGAGREVQVHEFKSYQFRIYGVVREHKGKRAFLGTACDPNKKKDKADPKKIKKAAEESEKVRS